jgi:iron complex outermembrane recepter protein
MTIRLSRTAIAVALSIAFQPAFAMPDDEAVVVVTASRFPERFLTKPLNVTVITAEEIRLSGAMTLPNLLSQKAGVALHDMFGSNGAYSTVDIRGFGTTAGQNTLILLDGRRLTDMDSANVSWSAVPLEAIERIEILRGSGAVLYGDGASAGVINIITRSPNERPDTFRASAKAGSYQTREAQLFASHASDLFGITFAGSLFDTNGYRKNNASWQQSGEAKMEWRLNAGTLQLTVGADKFSMRLPGPRCVANCVSGVSDIAVDRRGTVTPNDDSARDAQHVGVIWHQTLPFGELVLDYGHRERSQWIQSATMFKYRESDLTLNSLSPRMRIDHGAPGGRGALVLGIDWQDWRYGFIDAQDKGTKGQPFSTVDANQTNLGFYLQDTFDLTDRLSLLGGGRTENQKLSGKNRVDTTSPGWDWAAAAPDASTVYRQWAAELGLRYRLDERWSINGKLARAYRFGNIDESFEYNSAYNNSFQFLRPQSNRLHEVSLDWRQSGASAKAALFQNDVTDEIHLDPFTAGIGNTNLPPSRRRGLELEGQWQATTTLHFSAAFTYTDAKFLSGVLPGNPPFTTANIVIAGKHVPLVPRHKFDLMARWNPSDATRISAGINYVGSQYMDNDEANDLGVKIPAYTVANLRVEHQIDHWNLALAANNLFNEKYYSYAVKSQFTAGRYNAYPLPERNFLFSAEYRFY